MTGRIFLAMIAADWQVSFKCIPRSSLSGAVELAPKGSTVKIRLQCLRSRTTAVA